jgi:PAS domain S-box-containing protein
MRRSKVNKKSGPKAPKKKRSARGLSVKTASGPLTSDDPYRSLVDDLPFGVGIIQKGRLVLANSMFAKMLGYRSIKGLLGTSIEHFVEQRAQTFFSVMAIRQESGEATLHRFETEFRREDGTMIQVETALSGTTFRNKPALNISISDITSRKELEQRLRDSERLYRNVVNSMGDALLVTDMEGRVLDVNEEFEQLTGWSRTEALTASIPYPWIDDEDLKASLGWLESLRGMSMLRDFDMTWTNRDGRQIAVSVNTTLLKNAAGAPMVMVNLARDISERKAAQSDLSRQFQKLEVLFQLSRSLGGTLDPTVIARLTYTEVAKVIPVDVFEIVLYDQEQHAARPILRVRRENGTVTEALGEDSGYPEAVSERIADVISMGRPLVDLVSPPSDTTDADARPVARMIMPMISNERVIGIVSVESKQDIAYTQEQSTLLEGIASLTAIAVQKATLYQEIVEASTEIAARNKELDDFTYVVSHDLKEPLISVEGYAKILRQQIRDADDPSTFEYIGSIIASCTHMKGLIDDLLQLSRVSRVSEELVAVDLSELVNQVLAEMRFFIKERGAVVDVQELLPKVRGIKNHLKIVFRNLLSNAIKFCDKSDPHVEVRAEAGPRTVTVSIKDNGIGIPKEYQEQIFMIFQRLQKHDLYEGTGAGLTIVKKIVESHGGKIWVDSEPGVWTVFSFTLPPYQG